MRPNFKRINLVLLTLSFSTLFLSSCAVHSGLFSSNTSLSAANFKYIKVVQGQASVQTILGIGGMNVDALVREARMDMYQKFPLRDNQAYANVTVDTKVTNQLFLLKEMKVTISADIVEFNK